MLRKLHEMEPTIIKQWLDAGDALLIDVREVDEFNEEYIPKAQLFPASSFNPSHLPNGGSKKLVFQCRAGRRSEQMAVKWADHFGAPDAYSMAGGIEGWKKSGFAITSNMASSRHIQNKVYRYTGAMVLGGTLLAVFVTPWLLLLPALAGAGLLYAGLFGTSLFSSFLSLIYSKKDRD